MLIVRLRWSLTWAYMRKSSWQTVGFIIGVIMALSCIIGAGRGAWELGSLLARNNTPNTIELLQTVMIVGGAFVCIIVIMLQLMLFGQGTTLTADRFALYGIADRDLQFGMTLACALCCRSCIDHSVMQW